MNGAPVMGGGRSDDGTQDARRRAQEEEEKNPNSNSSSSSDGLRSVSLDAQRRVDAFLAEEPVTPLLRAVQDQVRTSLRVIDRALDQYGIEQLSLSYNGGKDCLVLLYLLLASLPRHFSGADDDSSPSSDKKPPFPPSFQAVYVVSRHPFPEVDAFVDASGAAYRLDIERVCMAMRDALHAYLAQRPRVRAVFVGTRRTDPHGQDLTHFDPTDPGWPDFMRVHPVIDWHYAEIWAFIRHLGIPYCELYDRGYTSLGGTTDTSPNPALRRVAPGDGDGVVFRPAYELMEDLEERLGRNR